MTEQPTHFDIIIIGSGPAGFTAAIYAARGGAATALFGGVAPGGQLLQTMEIENFPGFPDPVAGADLMLKMLSQAKRLGTAVFNEEITSVYLGQRPFMLTAGSGKSYTAGALIAATGAQARWLGMPSEQKFIGKGVSGCATCDGFFFRGKEVCVVGGGDSAAEDALFLTKFASKVYLVHRRDALRATFRLQEKLRTNPKIEIIYEHTPEEITGDAKVTGINLKNVKTGAARRLETPGVFIAIGHTPATQLFAGKLNLDDSGYIVTNETLGTSVCGVFAAGDVMDTRYKQAVVAAGAGCKAAMEALIYLEEVKK
ncbi:MAG: thioredoxin-disulfide reductase [Elusimicrobia bacterium RIFCSPHIGHO2_02_FULL_61_10]|nr:MAG: thioredoxin-disulfide reductase [Elusimicrobia bacterium RIFCSPHIGHO2_02_FULL_61_10]